jgi:hypothetical protein
MVYDSEVVLPSKLQYGSPRVQAYQPDEAEKAWQDVVDLLKESRDVAEWLGCYTCPCLTQD